MNIRQTLQNVKVMGKILWTALRNWRVIGGVHKKVKEDPLMNEINQLNKEVSECADCDESGRCEYHRERTEQVHRKVKEEMQDMDRFDERTW